MKIIETERLLLRNWQESDAPALFEICADPDLRSSGITSYENVAESLKTIKHWKDQDEMKAIICKSDNWLSYIRRYE